LSSANKQLRSNEFISTDKASEGNKFLLKRKQILSSKCKVALPRNVRQRLMEASPVINAGIEDGAIPVQRFDFSGVSRSSSEVTQKSSSITTQTSNKRS